jgi:hypothetical protein
MEMTKQESFSEYLTLMQKAALRHSFGGKVRTFAWWNTMPNLENFIVKREDKKPYKKALNIRTY